MKSIWSDTVNLPKFPSLKKDISTEVLIIGGGMAGILCAYFLKKQGVKCALVEAAQIGGGVTCDTTAKITAQHGTIYHMLYKQLGVEKASAYLRANEQAFACYRQMCKGMDCDFEEKDAYVYSRQNVSVLEQEVDTLRDMGFAAEFVNDLKLAFPTVGGVKFASQAQFHPLKFICNIVNNLEIYEHTAVLELKKHKAVTKCGTITANKVIIATHFPFLNKHGSYFMKMYQERSYVIALDCAPDVHGMYIDEMKHGISLRNYNGLLLVGGGGHRTGKEGGNWKQLEDFIRTYYPGANEYCRWAAQDCMTLDGMPYIGHYSLQMKDLYVATGFNKWGMTWSMASATILSDMILGKANEFAEIFSPSRNICRPQLFLNMVESTKNLLTPTSPRCPHLGCALKWNTAEHTWDCPCHGSRFEADGKLIDNPAMGNLKKYKVDEINH